MKLNEYIHAELKEGMTKHLIVPTEEDIDMWIVDWYNSEFGAVGCHGDLKGDTMRMPPMWLANWRKYV